MDLDQKYKLKLSADEAEALTKYLTWVLSHEPATAWEQMMFLLIGRARAKIKPDDFRTKEVTVKLNTEQSMALQMAIAVFEWPGNYIDHALHRSQQQLPPLIYSSAQPAPIAWDAPLELGERRGLD